MALRLGTVVLGAMSLPLPLAVTNAHTFQQCPLFSVQTVHAVLMQPHQNRVDLSVIGGLLLLDALLADPPPLFTPPF